MSRVTRKPVLGFPIRSDTNEAAQPQKMARDLKFRFREKRDCTIYVAKTKALISCLRLFVSATSRFSHDAPHIVKLGFAGVYISYFCSKT